MSRFFVVTTPAIIPASTISFRFLFDSKAPRDKMMLDADYGALSLAEKDEDHVNPFRLVRGEPNAIGPDGVNQWKIFLGKNAKQTLFSSVDESEGEEGLQSLIRDLPNANILMERKIYDRFEAAAKAAGAVVDVFHCEKELLLA